MPKKVLVLLAGGFEEVEAITPIDYLRRAGIEVTTASIDENLTVTGSHGIQVNADTCLASLLVEGMLKSTAWDAVILPGGVPGSDNLAASKETASFLVEMAGSGRWVCAICASPARVLSPLGLLEGKKYTCYPGEEQKVTAKAQYRQDRVVIDGKLITSRGAGTAGEFACAIIEELMGEGQGEKISSRVLMACAPNN